MTRGRTKAREWALQFLFQSDFNQIDDLEQSLADFWAPLVSSQTERAFAEMIVSGVLEQLRKLDRRLNRYMDNWEIDRIGGVDRNVMRIALYEMLYCDDIPPPVSINEAVEMAKSFGGENSKAFVNGVLDKARSALEKR